MKFSKIYVGSREDFNIQLKEEISNIGVSGVDNVKEFVVYWVSGLTHREVSKIAKTLLHNPLTQNYFINDFPKNQKKGVKTIEVLSNLGVIDPKEASVKKAIYDLGIKKKVGVRFGRLYLLKGKISGTEVGIIKKRILINNVIEHEVVGRENPFIRLPKYKFKLTKVAIRKAEGIDLQRIAEEGNLSLTIDEMLVVQDYFRNLGREPTDIELETIAQTWSEHCSHKTFKGNVLHNGESINNLLKHFLMDPSLKIKKPHVISAFKDNAGGIKIGNKVVSIKVETHNHPSAIEPVGGAETGIGGVIRDILGFGKGAKPTSSLVCFGVGQQNLDYKNLPSGVLHPRAILSGVVQGTKDYGNKMGIPTDFFQDSLIVDEDYLGNPLVYCGTIGICNVESARKSKPEKGDLVFLLGGLTGRDGIHGATFSSAGLAEKSESISGGAVQIGDAIMEKKTLDAVLELNNKGFIKWVTDCGGGGLSSAVGETGQDIGVKVDLEKVPKKYEGLSYAEIWISESQERMVVVSGRENEERILKICKKHSVPSTVIGEFTGNNKLELYYESKKVADLGMDFLHGSCPTIEKISEWKEKIYKSEKKKIELSKALPKLLRHPEIRSKGVFARQYDSTVQGLTIQGPLAGENEDVHYDTSVRQMTADSKDGYAVSISVNPGLTSLNPRKMTHWVVVQAVSKLAVVGAQVSKGALLDNFSWGSPDRKRVMGELVEALKGCKDVLEILQIPFISGKDSLNNEFKDKTDSISIPGTLLITALAPVPDVKKITKGYFEDGGNILFLIGDVRGELGGSYFNKVYGIDGGDAPVINLQEVKNLLHKFQNFLSAQVIRSASVVGKGGLAAALVKMSLASGIGARIKLDAIGEKYGLDSNQLLFSESGLKFVVEARKKDKAKIKKAFPGASLLGETGGDNFIVINKKLLASINLGDLSKSYNGDYT